MCGQGGAGESLPLGAEIRAFPSGRRTRENCPRPPPYLASSGVSVNRSSTPGRAMSCCTFLVPAMDREMKGGRERVLRV